MAGYKEYNKFKDIPLDETGKVAALVTKTEKNFTSTEKEYVKFYLSDGEEEVTASMWDKTLDDLVVKKGDVATFLLKTKLYNENRTYDVKKYGPAPKGALVTDYVLASEKDPVWMYERILWMVKKVCRETENESLAEFTEEIFTSYKEDLLWTAAAKSNHHNYAGGLLEHTMEVTSIVMAMKEARLDDYEGFSVRWDLCICGAALHDIGKVKELLTDEIAATDYTKGGEFLGHLVQGVIIVNDALHRTSCDISKDDAEDLTHIIASHHGELAWGSPTVPKTSEAYLVHEADMISSRMNMFRKAYNDTEPGEFSPKVFALGTKVYRRNDSVGEEGDEE